MLVALKNDLLGERHGPDQRPNSLPGLIRRVGFLRVFKPCADRAFGKVSIHAFAATYTAFPMRKDRVRKVDPLQ